MLALQSTVAEKFTGRIRPVKPSGQFYRPYTARKDGRKVAGEALGFRVFKERFEGFWADFWEAEK